MNGICKLLLMVLSSSLLAALISCGGGGGNNEKPQAVLPKSSLAPLSSSATSSASSIPDLKQLSKTIIGNTTYIHGTYNGQSLRATYNPYSQLDAFKFVFGPLDNREQYSFSEDGTLREILLMDIGYRVVTNILSETHIEYRLYDQDLNFILGSVLFYLNDRWEIGQLNTELFESYDALSNTRNVTAEIENGLSKSGMPVAKANKNFLTFSLFPKAEAQVLQRNTIHAITVGVGAAVFAAIFTSATAPIVLAVGVSTGLIRYSYLNEGVFIRIADALLNAIMPEASASDEIKEDYYLFTSPTKYSVVTPENLIGRSSSSHSQLSSSSTSSEQASSTSDNSAFSFSSSTASVSSASSLGAGSSSESFSSDNGSSSSESSINSSMSMSSQSSSFTPIRKLFRTDTFVGVTGTECNSENIYKNPFDFILDIESLSNTTGIYEMSFCNDLYTFTIPGFLKCTFDYNGDTFVLTYQFNAQSFTGLNTVTSNHFGCSWITDIKGTYGY